MERIISTKYLYWNMYIKISLLIFLVIASYFDKKQMKIPNKLNLIFFIIRLALIPIIGINVENIYGLLAGLFLILVPAMIKCKPMGGDIKMMAVLGFYLGVQNILILLVGTVIFALVYYIPTILGKKEKKDVPLAPFVLSSFILMNIIGFIIK